MLLNTINCIRNKAQNLNRQFIGIEKEEKYYNIAKERLGL